MAQIRHLETCKIAISQRKIIAFFYKIWYTNADLELDKSRDQILNFKIQDGGQLPM